MKQPKKVETSNIGKPINITDRSKTYVTNVSTVLMHSLNIWVEIYLSMVATQGLGKLFFFASKINV